MPIPKEQLSKLKLDLKTHSKRLESIRDSIKSLEEEVEVHEALLALGNDANVLAVLNELYDDPELANKIADRPGEHFAKKGVAFPPGTTIQLARSEPQATIVEARFKQGRFKYKVTWDRHEGFALAPLDD